MKRIAIIGCGGSGKTVLATQLGAKLELPVHHLDRLFWRPGWQETPKEEWAAVQRDLCAQPALIMDGNYGGTMALRLEAADTIIFLDYPTATCLWGAICRWLRYRGRTRPEMTADCPERLSVDYLRWIWTYRRKRRPGILRQLAGKRAIILRSRRETRAFVTAPATNTCHPELTRDLKLLARANSRDCRRRQRRLADSAPSQARNDRMGSQ